MKKEEQLELILDTGLIGIIRADSGDLMKVVAALKQGGVRVIEVTMTTPGALELIKEVAGRMKDEVLFGAGTVLDPETCRAAILAGAEFIVSPTLNPDVIKVCHRYGKVAVPGAFTPTEILAGWEAGAELIKVFPASNGGPEYIKSLHYVLPQVRLVPVGGVNLNNIPEYLKASASAFGVGGDLVGKKLVAEGNYAEITRLASEYCRVMKESRK